MKSNSGITLTSVIIYVMGLAIIVGLISTLTSFFYKNIDTDGLTDDTGTQYTKFTSVFSEEINKENNYVIDCKTNYIIFADGNQYTYKQENKSIYKNKIKICENIDQCDFAYTLVDGKYKITIDFKVGNMDLTGESAITYTF